MPLKGTLSNYHVYHNTKKDTIFKDRAPQKSHPKGGVHLNGTFSPHNVALMEISRSLHVLSNPKTLCLKRDWEELRATAYKKYTLRP